MKKISFRISLPVKIALIYAVVGLLWVFLSDQVLQRLITNTVLLIRIHILKDWFFISFSAIFLYFLLRAYFLSIQQSEYALRKSEEKFHMLVETTASGIFIYRERIILVNSAMERLTGYSKDELLGMKFLDFVAPEFKKKAEDYCDSMATHNGGPIRCDLKIVTKQGQERWLDCAASSIIYNGQKAGLGTAYDITELRRTMDALRESEENYRLLVEQVRDYEIFMLDPEGRIQSWNIGGEIIKGYRPEEIIGRSYKIFFTEEDIEKGLPGKELELAKQTGRSELEGWRVKKDGSCFWAHVVTTALYDAKGNLRGFSKVISDVTSRKEAEERLRESEERYRVIAETASDAIITIDAESTIILANPAVNKIFGYEPDEVIGKSLLILMPERYRERHLQGVRRFIETGRKDVNWTALEFYGLRKNGTEVPLEISYGFFLRDGRIFFTGIVRDITERKQAEKEKEYRDMLERFNMELEVLIAERAMSLMGLRLADQVRSPSVIIDWNSNRLLSRADLTADSREKLEAIAEQAHKLEATVKEYQGLLKGKRPSFSYENLNDIVMSVLPILETEAKRKKIELTVEMYDFPIKINAQKDLLRMAIFTMLRNAIETTPENGKVNINTHLEGDNVVFSVSDSGPGISPELLERLFEPEYSGLIYRFGIGLPIIKQIVSEHLGKIEVSSEPGRGTTFRVSFPVRWMEKVHSS